MSNPYKFLVLFILFNSQLTKAEDSNVIVHSIYHYVEDWGYVYSTEDVKRGYLEIKKICTEKYNGQIDNKSFKSGFIANKPLVIADCIENKE
jgi:hypothetical protein